MAGRLSNKAGWHPDDVGVLLFVVAILLVAVFGWRWVREREEAENALPGRGDKRRGSQGPP